MKKFVSILGIAASLSYSGVLLSHCQMPCGIYHDEMVYDQIDQYVETMYKGITVMNECPFKTGHDRNEYMRWVIAKDKFSDDTADIIMEFFLQQKIKPGEPDTAKRVESAHKLLFLLVQIKQNDDRKMVEDFADEWEKFKLMFHVEGYKCKVDELKRRKREEKAQQIGKTQAPKEVVEDHDHSHGDHTHTH